MICWLRLWSLAFNSIRLPFSNAMLHSERIVDTVDPRLTGLTPIQSMDLIIETAGELGLKIVLDNHSRAPDSYLSETLWYTDEVSDEDWINDWVMLAERYKDNPTVVGFDLNNEPHGEATWGTNDLATDWKLAAERCAEAVHAVHPEVLIIVEGVEVVNGVWYWWGGNLQRCHRRASGDQCTRQACVFRARLWTGNLRTSLVFRARLP